ncbi:carbon-nitrogen hydrolase family protein [Roseateles oligotrophus]|uniref:Carbon-nitrogen hydrolase family protein n=1 Tax=Roseateles oligotrophus TaxID=1769250 RepID=A0ABT2YJX0_9BURK|nr:carbon-nitrogen hydrolase family protein [Roseateles oligotrophus]MCV2370349.1 carbon-nitrogen hydrolase family protein [Roseateles oligotrophus]
MKIAAVQMVSGPDPVVNLARARHWLEQAGRQGAELVALPEYFCLMGQADGDKLALAETPGDANAPIQRMLSQAAADLGLWLIGGTLPLRTPSAERVRNACCVYAPDGSQVARYDKIHLFRFDNGSESYDEGRVLEAGNEPVAVQAGPLRVALSVCYDLRFPELYRSLAPVDLISVPAAFTYVTGQAHWELLLRARAVENQAYVIAPAQGGLHQNGRRTWGHTMIIDPWGVVLGCLPEGEGLVLADVDAKRLGEVRRQLPALQHRRL